MKIYDTQVEPVKYLQAITCDRCKKVMYDEFELQESLSLSFIGGYSSVFGDGANVEADLCQQCLKELIGGFCRYC